MNRLNCAQEWLHSGDHEPTLNFKGKASQELLGNRDAAYIDVASFIGATIRKPSPCLRNLSRLTYENLDKPFGINVEILIAILP